MIDKQVKTTAEAVAGVRDGSTVLVAGFGAVAPRLQLAPDWKVLAPPAAPKARAA